MLPATPIAAGACLQTRKYGLALVRKVYPHRDTGEMVADVKCLSGEHLHLTLRYAAKLLVH